MQNQFSNLSLHNCAQLTKSSWKVYRAGRITASICNRIYKIDPTMELSTRDCYIAMQKQQHVNLSVRETGFHVRVDYLFLGASLDGIVLPLSEASRKKLPKHI